MDCRRTAATKSIRYASMIAPSWLRDGTESALWTSQTAIDTALTGDVWATSWTVYCAGGIASQMFDLSPSRGEVRTFRERYRLVGKECGVDPPGSVQTHRVPNSIGKVTVITTEWGPQYSQHSHITVVNNDALNGRAIFWPPCVDTGVQPTLIEMVVILGGHVGLLGEETTEDQFLWMVPRLYAGGLVRHILRASQNHFEGNLPSASSHGRAGGPPPPTSTIEFFLNSMRQVYGQDRLSAVVSGIALGTRAKYLTAWNR